MSPHFDRPLISIVIRNRNEAQHLSQLFASLQSQRLRNYEVILVDNASTDGSVAIATQNRAHIVALDRFSYGRALNRGIESGQGEFIVILSSHSVPLGREFLRECAGAFEDPEVAAARLVYVGKGADMLRWTNPELLETVADDWISKGPLASGCVIRRSVWEKIPFDEDAIAAEDKLWTREVLRRGYKVISPIPAFYYYAKPMSRVAELKKNYCEIVAIRSATGSVVGFVGKGSVGVLISALIGSVAKFLEDLRFVLTRFWLTLKFPRM